MDYKVDRVKRLARGTFTDGVLSDIGTFGGLFRPELGGMDEPVLVASADGVGTKLKVAFAANEHRTVGLDLVNHCVNDILVQGARPIFFLDYLATELIKNNWRMKPLHRLIVTSEAYKRASAIPHSALRIPHSKDPDNKFLWHMNSGRAEAEDRLPLP